VKKAYFLNRITTQLIDYDLCRLLHGLRKKNFEIIPVEKLSLCPFPEKNICFVGDIIQTHSYFQLHKIMWNSIPTYPDNCEIFLKRSIEKINFNEALKKEGEFFIKPISKTVFTPNTYNFPLNSDDMLNVLHVSENCPVYMSDCVCFEQEYRCFSINNCIEDVRQYSNSGGMGWSTPINSQFIDDINDRCLPNNKSYVFDVGILSDGEWALVEFNDGICVGSYGLDPDLYSDLFLVRWCEIMESVA